MSWIDFILNLVCVLLWLNWRAVRLTAPTPAPVLSLAASLKRAEPRSAKRWLYLCGLAVLLGVRGLFYWQVGSALHWTPTLRLGAIAPPFRSDYPGRMQLYSALSFLVALGVFYLWLLLLSIVNRDLPEADPIQRLLRLQLGRANRWPWWVQLALPGLVVALSWLGLNGLFVRLGLVAAVPPGALWQQAVILGGASYLAWKYFLIGLLAIHLVNSYVYIGPAPIWNYVSLTGARLLRPLRPLPLRFGKVDLAPVVAVALVWGIAAYADRGLTHLYQHPVF
jgi:uncharacterized protein YggT (Ycf19 family)